MDLSRSTESRVGTDFTIENILRKDEGRPVLVSPPWLLYSRYQPPRIQRATAACARSRRTGRHARIPFTPAQSAALETAFARAPYLAPHALRALAQALQLREDRIKIWFQNRRARERRERMVPAPEAIALPATPAPGHADTKDFPPASMPPGYADTTELPPRDEDWDSDEASVDVVSVDND